MFYIKKIWLQNFKNYSEFEAVLSPHINAIVGKNGIGKTNFLDAIYYLGFTKSAFNSIDSQLIRTNEPHFILNGHFANKDDSDFISCRLIAGKKKEINKNKKPIKKVADHIGNYPIVMVTPYDTDLIRDSSESRRKFFDGLISQMDSKYLELLLKYKNLVKQRNALLKTHLKTGRLDDELLSVLTEQMIPIATSINKQRAQILKIFTPEFQKIYAQISSGDEQIGINYSPQTSKKEIQLGFKQSEEKDKILGRTNYGPHRDDYEFLMNDISVNKFASQGQQKSFIIALKVAQFNLIENAKKIKPILMLDDFFDRIDHERIDNFVKMLEADSFGQVFITDSHPERVESLFKRKEVNLIEL